jgi:hypothetical protein
VSHDLVDLGASKLDPNTNAVLVQAKSVGVTEDRVDAPDYGDVQLSCALGLAAKPFPSDDTGGAQGIVANDIPGISGRVIAANDNRFASVYAELSPGDVALHGVGPEHQSQVRCQEKMVSIVTVDADDFNALIVVDGKNRKISISGFGHVFEMSKENGVSFAEEGGAGVFAKDGVLTLKGSSIAIGEGATSPVHHGFGAGSTSIPSLSILVPP